MVTAVDGRVAGSLARGKLVYRWDLDKTYLRTDFDTVRALLRTAFEPARRKRTVPGAAPLIRELRSTDPAGIYILSGSPEQMRKVLETKLRLDGVRWDSFTLKPSLANMLRGRFRYLHDNVGYKLGALFESRRDLAPDLDEVMFGDDAEADAFIYSLYADVCAGKVPEDGLIAILERSGVHAADIPRIVQLASQIERRDFCRRIFIRLDRVSSPEAFDGFGQRVCPFFNYFQPALVLLEMGALDAAAALRVAAELVINHGFSSDALTASYEELARRGRLGRRAADSLKAASRGLTQSDFVSAAPALDAFCREIPQATHGLASLPPPGRGQIDYLAVLASDRARAKDAKRRVLRRH